MPFPVDFEGIIPFEGDKHATRTVEISGHRLECSVSENTDGTFRLLVREENPNGKLIPVISSEKVADRKLLDFIWQDFLRDHKYIL
jgi:hypothetical protein